MALVHLSVTGFRVFAHAEFSPDPGVNLIVGSNGAGKTSLLEAIYYLGRGRSFRTRQVESVRRRSCEQLRIVGRIREEGRSATLGIERDAYGQRIRVDRKAASGSAECARLLPIQVVHPGSHRLLEEGPRWRRQFVDWGVFHVEPLFHPVWKRYSETLRQRNAALRAGRPEREISLWDPLLIRHGEELSRLRFAYVERLAEGLPRLLEQVGLELPIEVTFNPGWKRDEELKQGLAARISTDRNRGFTSVGPHRADLVIRSDRRMAREVLSRGQQKLLVLALVLTQALLHRDLTGRSSVMLLDDLSAELDSQRRRDVLHLLRESALQCFLTATDEDAVGGTPDRMFHVEQGRIQRVI